MPGSFKMRCDLRSPFGSHLTVRCRPNLAPRCRRGGRQDLTDHRNIAGRRLEPLSDLQQLQTHRRHVRVTSVRILLDCSLDDLHERGVEIRAQPEKRFRIGRENPLRNEMGRFSRKRLA